MTPNDGSDVAARELARSLRMAITTAFREQLRTAEEALTKLDHECVDLFELNGELEQSWPSNIVKWSQATLSPQNFAIARLLELKLAIYRDAPEKEGLPWYYEWTYLGRQTIALWRALSMGRKRYPP